MGKHAYLIMAHRCDGVLETLLKAIDDERNDIFFHMDKKNKTYDYHQYENLLKKSSFTNIPRIRVNWGDFSQVEVELLLLEAACNKGEYDYYHLLSGADLPIKTQDYIHDFFDKNQGAEFVRFTAGEFAFGDRVYYRYPLQPILGRTWGARLNPYFKRLQHIFHLERNKGIDFKKGGAWFSITDKCARYVLSKRKWIKKIFNMGVSTDEIFLQTIVYDSEFYDKLYDKTPDADTSYMRAIDWQRGFPYTWREVDFDYFKSSELLFARKFDESVDANIIKKIEEELV